MKKLVLSLAVLSAILLPELCTAPAHADTSIRTFVSGTGSDSNSSTACSQPAAPCQSFSAALAVTMQGGEINCAGPVEYTTNGPITITQSVTIDCHDMFATYTLVTGSNGITINAPGSDVILRNLNLDGFVQFNNGSAAGTDGILISAASRVEIDNCKIFNFGHRGISDARTTGSTQLFIRNSIIRGNTGTGIVVAAAPKNSVVLENVHSVGNGFGVAVATGNNVVINRSVMSENSIAGIEADPGATVFVDNTEISHNVSYGIYALGTVTLANSDITFNTSSIHGSTLSYGNNRIFGNGAGDAPTLISQQ
jgi:hypothetical protein